MALATLPSLDEVRAEITRREATCLHPGQRKLLDEARRFNVAACGRRWGKSYLAIDLMSRTAAQGLPVGYFAPTYKLLIEVWEQTMVQLHSVIKSSNKTERRIECGAPGGLIEMWTMEDEDAGRSRKYARVILDEAGLVPSLNKRWHDAIRPTLADLEGDAWLFGTPKGRNGFYDAYQRGLDPLQHDWRSWQLPTSDNPYIPPSEIADMQRDMPERSFRQEIEAEFLEDGGGVFRNVTKASVLEPEGRIDGHTYTIGADWARSGDFSIFSVVDATVGKQVYLDRFTDIEYSVQRGRLHALADKYRPIAILAEENSIGVPVIEELRREGLSVQGFVTTNATKAEVVDGLALALERDTILLLNNEVQKNELQAFSSERLPSGLIRYSAPEGMHDDTVMALMLAWYAAHRYYHPWPTAPPETDEERENRLHRERLEACGVKVERKSSSGW